MDNTLRFMWHTEDELHQHILPNMRRLCRDYILATNGGCWTPTKEKFDLWILHDLMLDLGFEWVVELLEELQKLREEYEDTDRQYKDYMRIRDMGKLNLRRAEIRDRCSDICGFTEYPEA